MGLSRPMHDYSVDKQAKAEIGALLIERWSLSEVVELSVAYVIDFACLRGLDVMAFAEIKDRSLTFGFGDGFYVTLHKARASHDLMRLHRTPCFLVVRFAGGEVHFAAFDQLDMMRVRVAAGRRKDRDDPADREPFVTMPWSAFKLLGVVP